VGLIDPSQQELILTGELGGEAMPLVGALSDVAGAAELGDQPGELGGGIAGHLAQIPAQEPLLRPRLGEIVIVPERLLDPGVGLTPGGTLEHQGLAGAEEGAQFVAAHQL